MKRQDDGNIRFESGGTVARLLSQHKCRGKGLFYFTNGIYQKDRRRTILCLERKKEMFISRRSRVRLA